MVGCNHQDSRKDNLRRHIRLVHGIENGTAHNNDELASPGSSARTMTAHAAGTKRKQVETVDTDDLSRDELVKRLRDREMQLVQKDNEILQKGNELLKRKIELLQKDNELREERLKSSELEQKLNRAQEKNGRSGG